MFEAGAELLGGVLSAKTGDDHSADQQSPTAQAIDHFERVGVVRDAKIRAHFFAFDITRKDAKHNLGLVLELLQKAYFDIRIVAG